MGKVPNFILCVFATSSHKDTMHFQFGLSFALRFQCFGQGLKMLTCKASKKCFPFFFSYIRFFIVYTLFAVQQTSNL